MNFKPSTCNGCTLYNNELEVNKITSKYVYEKSFSGRGFVQSDGDGSNGVVIITDPPGDYEVSSGVHSNPSSASGSVLERVIHRSPGLKRNEFKIGSIIQCQPPFNKLQGTSWYRDSIDHCQIHRDSFINSIPLKPLKSKNYKQRIILALGDNAFRTLTGLDGEYLNLEAIRGYPIDTPYGIVIGSIDPARITKGEQKLTGVLMLDLRKAVYLAKNGFTRHQIDYKENPSLKECKEFLEQVRNNPDKTLALDIETPNVNDDGSMPSMIFSIQFSLDPYTGIFFNWIGEEEEIAREILGLNNNKIVYNGWRFDIPMLEKMGCKVNGRIDDAIWAFHHYQPDITIENKDGENASISSRMGLQYVASFFDMDYHWKYMKKYKEMSKQYGIADVDSLQRIWSSLPQQMKRLGVWDGYDKVRYSLEPVLVNMSKRGIPVDETKRVELRQIIQLDKEVNFDMMQSLVPLSLRNIEPKGGYKRGWDAVKVKDMKIRVVLEDE